MKVLRKITHKITFDPTAQTSKVIVSTCKNKKTKNTFLPKLTAKRNNPKKASDKYSKKANPKSSSQTPNPIKKQEMITIPNKIRSKHLYIICLRDLIACNLQIRIEK